MACYKNSRLINETAGRAAGIPALAGSFDYTVGPLLCSAVGLSRIAGREGILALTQFNVALADMSPFDMQDPTSFVYPVLKQQAESLLPDKYKTTAAELRRRVLSRIEALGLGKK